jgi:flavin reductase (DIM6/NTAB) family NADH-FMN oxidoreductase RutF
MTEHTPNADETISDGIDAFKSAFRRHAAGVAIVTARDAAGRPVGFTATSLASLAAVPPMATFNMAQIASAWPAMTVGNRVVIHMLSPRTRAVAQRMAADHRARFEGGHWHPGPFDLPVVDGATAWVVGRIIEVHPVHNNAVVVVEIESGELGEPEEALLYHERAYRIPGPVVE